MPSRHAVASLAALLAGASPLPAADRTFDDDVAFLRRHVEVVVLGEGAGGARVAVVPAWQGRVMTSTVGGAAAPSHGWTNDELVASRRAPPAHQRVRRRGPVLARARGRAVLDLLREGRPLRPRALADPAPRGHRALARRGERAPGTWPSAGRDGSSTTRARRFDLQVDRTVRLLDAEAVARRLGADVPARRPLRRLRVGEPAHERREAPWTKEDGLLSLWILGMFKPSPRTTVVIPYREGAESDLGPVVNDAYFGKVPADRLLTRDGVLFFRGDGRYRSKIGLSPRRARPVLGSYDALRGVLTIVPFDKPEGALDYVNSMWEIQKEPFARRRRQQLQRRPARAGGEAPRALLRARDVLARGRARSRRRTHPRPPHLPLPGRGAGPGRAGAPPARGRPRGGSVRKAARSRHVALTPPEESMLDSRRRSRSLRPRPRWPRRPRRRRRGARRRRAAAGHRLRRPPRRLRPRRRGHRRPLGGAGAPGQVRRGHERRRRPPVGGRRRARAPAARGGRRRRGAGSASPSTRCSTTTTASSSRPSPCGSSSSAGSASGTRTW